MHFVYSVFKNNDLIIINGYNNYPFLITFLLNIFSLKRRFIAIDSDTQLTIPSNILKRVIKWLYLSIIFRVGYTLGFSGGSDSHKDLFRFYGMKEDRIFLIPMMVDNSRFFQKEKSFPELFTFLYVGRIVKIKNVEGLIQQFNKNFSSSKAVLKIIGTGPEESILRAKYASENVSFLGAMFDDELVEQFSNASCLVLPSKHEPWGLVVNEALSSSLPVITTSSVGANADLIKGRSTGMIASNMDDFGGMMLELYNNVDLLEEFSENAAVLMKYTWNYSLYQKCLKGVIKKIESCS